MKLRCGCGELILGISTKELRSNVYIHLVSLEHREFKAKIMKAHKDTKISLLKEERRIIDYQIEQLEFNESLIRAEKSIKDTKLLIREAREKIYRRMREQEQQAKDSVIL